MASKTRIVWLFGRSGAGKTTLASLLVDQYRSMGTKCLWLDGDRVRRGLSQELGFSAADRMENHRRIIEVANIAAEQGLQVVISAMAPIESIRSKVNELAQVPIAWIYLETNEDICRQRDTKGLYASTQGESFRQPFEPPAPDSVLIKIDTSSDDISVTQAKIFSVLGIPTQ